MALTKCKKAFSEQGDRYEETKTLTEALEDLQAAQAAQADALAEVAQVVNANEETPLTGDDLTAFVEGFTAANATTELAAAETAVGTAQAAALNAESALVTARNVIEVDAATVTGTYLDGVRQTDANLTTALNAVRADIAATAGTGTDVSALLNDRTAAVAALNSHIGTNGSNTQLLTNLRTAITNYLNSNEGDADLALNVTPDTVGDLLALINVALATDAGNDNTVQADTLVDSFTALGVSVYEVTAPATALETAIQNAIDAVDARDGLEEDVVDAEAALGGETLGADLLAIEQLIEDREGLVSDLAEAQADLSEAQAYFAELAAAVAAHDTAAEVTAAATDALEALGIENLVELGDVSTAGTAGAADLYLFSATNTDTNDTDAIALLNFEANDVLFVGTGFTRVDLAADADLENQRLGDASALEVFFQQDGTNAIITIETQAFGGSAENLADVTTITLTGVNVADLVYADGFISVAA